MVMVLLGVFNNRRAEQLLALYWIGKRLPFLLTAGC